MASIYCITNIITKKKYIGQTLTPIHDRFKKHKAQINCKNQCSALYASMRKHGSSNFIIESIIDGDFSKEELNLLEINFIIKYKTISPFGYNLQSGGKSFRVSNEVKEKIKKALNNREIKWADKISSSMIQLWKNSAYRKKMSDSHKGKRGTYKKKKMPLRANVDKDEINRLYQNGLTIHAISKHLNVSFSVIKKRIKI